MRNLIGIPPQSPQMLSVVLLLQCSYLTTQLPTLTSYKIPRELWSMYHACVASLK
jgi:hypothetical protein